MLRARDLAVAVFLLPFLAGAGHAGALEDGRDLKRYCSEDAAHVQQAACFAYILGIADLLAGYEVKGFRVCFPDGVGLEEIVAKTGHYLDDNPDRLDSAPNQLVLDALIEAFPCMR